MSSVAMPAMRPSDVKRGGPSHFRSLGYSARIFSLSRHDKRIYIYIIQYNWSRLPKW